MDDVNLLSDGMHSDNEPALQPKNTYRDAKNGNLISKGGNRYSFESIYGTTVSFTIPVHASAQKPFQVVGWTSFTDMLIIMLANDNASPATDSEIAKVTFDNSGVGTYTPLYYHTSLGFSKNYPIPHDGIIAKEENTNIKRVVWTDNNKSLRTLNVADSRLTTNVASLSLVVGSKYMVLSTSINSYITHNASTYGPGLVNGNVFTAQVTNYAVTGTVIVIEYIPVESLDVSLDFMPGNIDLLGWGSGSLVSGNYQYFYQLETSAGGRSNWSYLTNPIYNITNITPDNTTLQYASYLAIAPGSNTGKSIKLRVAPVDNTVYTKIRVGFIRSTADGVYTSPAVFLYQSISSTSFDLTHYGNEVILETLTLSDITTANAILDLVKSIATTKNILFAANVGLSKDPSVDMSGVTIKCIEHLMVSDFTTNLRTAAAGKRISDLYGIFGHGQLNGFTTGSLNTISYPYQWYEVVGTQGTVTYNAVVYTIGQFFQGGATPLAITKSAAAGDNAVAVGVARIRKYTAASSLNADTAYKNHRLEYDYADHKGLCMSYYKKSYWAGETYRFGVFFYGKKGQQNFVLPIGDKTIPHRYDVAGTTETINVKNASTTTIGFNMQMGQGNFPAANEAMSLRAIGLNFSNIDFTPVASAYGVALADLNTVIKGFSIVRLPLDAQIQSQGVVWGNMANGTSTQLMAQCIVGQDFYATGGVPYGRRKNSYMYYSPDDLNGENLRPNAVSGDYLELVQKYNRYENDADDIWLGDGLNNYYNKYYTNTSLGTDVSPYSNIYLLASRNYLNAGNTKLVDRGALSVSAPGLPGVFNNKSNGAIAYIGGNWTSYGVQGVLVNTSSNETTYSQGIGSYGQFDQNCSVVNWVRPKTNLYGGTDASVVAAGKYIYCGHYQPLDTDFMTYMTGIVDGGGAKAAGIVNNVEVWGGDCFVSLFGLGRTYDTIGGAAGEFSHGFVVPIESNINENWRGYSAAGADDTHRTFNRNRFYDPAYAVKGICKESAEVFTYDGAYLGAEKEYFFLARPQNFAGTSRDEHLVVYSLEKVDGEILNNWNIFKINNYKRVDGQYGAINNIRAKASRLFYWQNRGVGYMPVQERVTQGSALGSEIQLGVGGTLDRFDEIDYYYGNQHQFSLYEGEDAFGWFDWRRKAIMRLGFGGSKDSPSIIKGLDSFFQTHFEEVEAEAGNTIFNSDNPLTGKGIMGYYDPRFKLGLLIFKYDKTSGTIAKDFAIGLSRHLDKFVGFFDITPNHIISYNGHLLMTKEIRQTIQNSTAYVVGDEINYLGTNYVCIVAYTSANPATNPASDTTHWTESSKIRDVHVGWRGSVCKLFGVVKPSYISVILKSQGIGAMNIDNAEVAGNDTAFSDIYTENSVDTADDTNIPATSRNHRYFDGSWWFSLPLKNKVFRLIDHYLQVKLYNKNFVTNPTTAINKIKRIFYVRNFYRNKK